MSRYDWPTRARDRRFRPGRGRAADRRSYNSSLNTGFDSEALAEARARRHSAEANTRTLRDASPIAMAAPPIGPGADRDLWLPVGPSVTLRGQADSDPRVAGRVRDITVSADGQRAYAASALGGLWYTDTAGARWEPVGMWAMVANVADLAASSHTLTCGAVHVHFDNANNEANDEVWVATGEPGAPIDFGVTGNYAGVGILHATGPVRTSRTTPLVDPWTREAQPQPAGGGNPAYPGLRGAGVYRLAADPADDHHLVAATTRGLHHNGSGVAAEPWEQVTVAAWEALLAGTSATAIVTDVAWTPATAGHPARLWVAVVDQLTPAAQNATDVWVSTNGVAGPFTQVNLPGVMGAVLRLGFGSDPAFPDVVYVLGSGPLMWRIDGIVPTPVAPLPAQLFGAVGDQSDYDLALAIDPTNVNRVLVGGAAATSPFDASASAALYRLTIGGAAPAYNTDYAGGEAADARWAGAEVHADIHCIHWRQVGGAGQVWVCCDGGVFRSTAAATPGSFASRATGLAITEASFVANHPVSDGLLLAGVQDNGAQMRIGESVWRRTLVQGDTGGVAFDPANPGRFVAQMHNADWNDDGGDWIGPSWRGPASAAYNAENGAARFYANAAVLQRGDGVTQLAVGTTRVWYSERWGRSRWDGAFWRRQWVTLPGGADPRAGDANDIATDVLAPGPQPTVNPNDTSLGIRVLRWGSQDRLYVVLPGAIYRLDRNPPINGAWATTNIVTRPAPPVVAAAQPWPMPGANLPDSGALNDLAVHNAAAGAHGSFYVATSHPLEPIWWFDGVGRWFPARLGTTNPPAGPIPPAPPIPARGVRAPAYAVAVDPDDATVVYAGTAVGVWRGVLTPGATPSWDWHPFNSGLPEAAVQDIAIGRWPRPGGGTLKLLRTALQARGVWEIEPGADATPTTFLRVHPYDTRRFSPAPTRDPMWNLPTPEREWPLDWADRRNRDYRTGGGTPRAAPDGTPVGDYPWHGSPDMRLRPAQATAPVPPAPGLPWTAAPPDRFWLWSIQTALRTIDPLIVADGRWTAWWRSRLRAVRVRLGIDAAAPGLARVSAALWNHAQVQAGFWADPWADGGPTEADLIERIVGMPTPRVGGPASRATSPATLAALRRPYHVDVCLHHRGREPLLPGTLAVILLRFPLPADPATWAALPPLALPAGPALTALRAALDALPPGGGALPGGFALPAGWVAADAGVAVRRPTQPVGTGAPAVVTFNVDFSAQAAGARWLFVALAHSAADPLTLAGADLRATILGSRHAAARSVQLV